MDYVFNIFLSILAHLVGAIYCCFIHAKMKNRNPKNLMDFGLMTLLPLVLFNLIRDKDYYQ